MASEPKPAPILGLATRLLRTRLAEPVRTAIHDAAEMDHVLVRLHAQGGVTGIGHLFAFGEGWARSLEAMVQQLGAVAVGADALDPEALHARLLGAARFMGLNGAAQMAVAALDTACWDVAGRLRGEPLWSLLGGSRRELPCYASDSLWLGDPIEELGGKASRRLELGFEAMKVRVGSPDVAADERRVAEVRAAVGPKTMLMADANQGWGRAHAIEAGRRLAQHDLYWLEEPVVSEDYASMRAVAEGTGLPIATGESWFGLEETRTGLETGAISVLMPDLERIGGVTGWMRAATAARAAGVRVSPHLFPEVSIHLMCAQPDDHLLEWVPWFEDLFEGSPVVREGRLEPGENPGLGFEFAASVFPA